MKFIDEKGRLFGKVNLIDLLAIVLVVAVVAVIGLKSIQPSGAPIATDDDMVDVTYTVLCRMVHNDIADYIVETQEGKQLMSNGELVESCFIESIERGTFFERYVTNDGEPKMAESDEYCDLTFVISGQCPYLANSYKVGSQEVRVAKSHIVKTVDFEMTGTIMELTGTGVSEQVEAVNG